MKVSRIEINACTLQMEVLQINSELDQNERLIKLKSLLS